MMYGTFRDILPSSIEHRDYYNDYIGKPLWAWSFEFFIDTRIVLFRLSLKIVIVRQYVIFFLNFWYFIVLKQRHSSLYCPVLVTTHQTVLLLSFFQRFRSNIAAHAVCAGDSRDFITSRHNLIRKGSGPQSWRGNHESLPAERKVGFLTELPPCSLIYAATSDDCEKVREVRRGSHDKESQGRRN